MLTTELFLAYQVNFLFFQLSLSCNSQFFFLEISGALLSLVKDKHPIEFFCILLCFVRLDLKLKIGGITCSRVEGRDNLGRFIDVVVLTCPQPVHKLRA